MQRWWSAFDDVIRGWIRDDTESMTCWAKYRETGNHQLLQQMAQRGSVDADSHERVAVWEAFLYQRGHIDAFHRALTPIIKWRENPPEAIGVIDYGCGSGSVAFAFDEHFEGETPLFYVGLDHHAPSLDLCDAMLSEVMAGDGGLCVTVDSKSVDALDCLDSLDGADRVFLTMGYLLCQPAVTSDVARDLANSVARVTNELGMTRLIVVDAPLSRSKYPDLMKGLRSAGLDIDEKISAARDYEMRFPALDGEAFRGRRLSKADVHYFTLRSQRAVD